MSGEQNYQQSSVTLIGDTGGYVHITPVPGRLYLYAGHDATSDPVELAPKFARDIARRIYMAADSAEANWPVSPLTITVVEESDD